MPAPTSLLDPRTEALFERYPILKQATSAQCTKLADFNDDSDLNAFLFEQWGFEDRALVARLAHHRATPEWVLLEMCATDNVSVATGVAKNSRATKQAIDTLWAKVDQMETTFSGRLFRDDEALMRALVRNKHTTVERLRWAANHKLGKVRGAVAMHPDCPVDLLNQIAWDKMSIAARDALSRPGVEEAAMRHWAAQPEHRPQVAIAKNIDCPVDLLLQLARPDSDGYRKARRGTARGEARYTLQRQIARDFDIARDNTEAQEMLMSFADWHTLEPDSPQVELVKALYPNSSRSRRRVRAS